MVLLEHLAAHDGPDQVWTFRVHEINREILCPSMLFQKPQMGFSVVPYAAGSITICCVAFDDCSPYVIDYRFPEFRREVILVAFLS